MDTSPDTSSSYLLMNKLNMKSMAVILPWYSQDTLLTHKPFDMGGLNAIWGDTDTVTIKHIALYFHIHTFQIKM